MRGPVKISPWPTEPGWLARLAAWLERWAKRLLIAGVLIAIGRIWQALLGC